MAWFLPKWAFRRKGLLRRDEFAQRSRPRFETTLVIRKLEPRRVLSVTPTLTGDILTLESDANDNTIQVDVLGANLRVVDEMGTQTFALNTFNRLNFTDLGGNDTLTFEDVVTLIGSDGVSLQITGLEQISFDGTYNLDRAFLVTDGGVTTTAASSLNVGTLTSIQAGSQAVSLGLGTHNLQGTVSVSSTDDVSLGVTNHLRLHNVTVGGNFIATATGTIWDTPAGVVSVTGTTTFVADEVLLDNQLHDFAGALSSQTANRTIVTDTNSLLLDNITTGAGFVAAAQLDIEDTVGGTIQVGGGTGLSGRNIVLDNLVHDFQGQVTLQADLDATLVDANTLIIKQAMIGNALHLTAVNDLLDQNTGAIIVAGPTTLSAINIVWDNGEHDFQGDVSAAAANNMELTDISNLTIDSLVVGNHLRLDVVQDITQTPTGAVAVTASSQLVGRDVLLSNTANDFGGLVQLNAGRDASLGDTNNLLLADISVARDLTIDAGAGVFDVDLAEIQVGRNASITAELVIRLANAATNRLVVDGLASFTSRSESLIDLGAAGASGAVIEFETLALAGGVVRIYETDDTHFGNVAVDALQVSTANQITQVDGTTIRVRNLGPAVSTLLLLRSGTGSVYLARGSSDPHLPGLTLNDGAVAANRLDGPVRVAGNAPTDLGVTAVSSFRLSNVSSTAQFPEFAGLPPTMELALANLELLFAGASVALPAYRFDIQDELRIHAGVTNSDATPTLMHPGATITDTFGTLISVGNDAEFVAADRIRLASAPAADPTDINLMIGGLARFHVVDPGKIDIGVQPVANANSASRAQAGGRFSAGRLSFQSGTSTYGDVTIREIDATRIDGTDNFAETLVLISAGNITSGPASQLTIDGPADGNAFARFDAGANNVVLGNELAPMLSLPSHGQTANGVASRQHYVAAAGQNVSLHANSGMNLRDDVGVVGIIPRIATQVTGSLAVHATGNIVQVGRPNQGRLTANSAVLSGNAVLLYDTEFQQLAARAAASADVNALAVISNRLPRDAAHQTAASSELLPYNLNDINVANPNPVPADFDIPFESRDAASLVRTDLSDLYGIVVRNRGTLRIQEVPDLTGASSAITGIQSATGHAFVEAIVGGTAGDIVFDGMGTAATPATIVQIGGDGVFTALAARNIIIADHSRLVSATGSVADIGEYSSFDDRVTNDTLPKVGVRLQLERPDADPTARTSRNVNFFDGLQKLGLTLGREGESNLFVAVKWANLFAEWSGAPEAFDIRRYEEMIDASDPDYLLDPMTMDVGIQVDMQTRYTVADMLNSPFGPLLPTTIMAFHDPAINLYDFNGGAAVRNLNMSILAPDAMPISRFGMEAPPGGDFSIPGNYVLALLSLTHPADPIEIRPSSPLQLDSPAPVVLYEAPAASRELVEFDDIRPGVVLGADLVEYGKRVNDALTEPKQTWDGSLEVDYVRQIMREIEADPMMRWGISGRFRIEIRLKNGLYRTIDLIKDQNRRVRVEQPGDAQAGVDPATSPTPDAAHFERATSDSAATDKSRFDSDWLAAWSNYRPVDQGIVSSPVTIPDWQRQATPTSAIDGTP